MITALSAFTWAAALAALCAGLGRARRRLPVCDVDPWADRCDVCDPRSDWRRPPPVEVGSYLDLAPTPQGPQRSSWHGQPTAVPLERGAVPLRVVSRG